MRRGNLCGRTSDVDTTSIQRSSGGYSKLPAAYDERTSTPSSKQSPSSQKKEHRSHPKRTLVQNMTAAVKKYTAAAAGVFEEKEHRYPSSIRGDYSDPRHQSQAYPPNASLRPSVDNTPDISPQCEGNTNSDLLWEPYASTENRGTQPPYNAQRLPVSHSKSQNNQPASSGCGAIRCASYDGYNRSKVQDSYHYSGPPPGSYLDDDTGPSPKLLSMAVTAVKSAVNPFAKMLMSGLKNHASELKKLMAMIRHEGSVERSNHEKFLVQAFICKHLFDAFTTKNGYRGSEYFDNDVRSRQRFFADFTRFKDKAATISMLLSNEPLSQMGEDNSIGNYCFEKFKLICGDSDTNQPFPVYEEDWRIVSGEQHPNSEFYRSFLKVAVSVWLLHRLTHSFPHEWQMLTYCTGDVFRRKYMESVVPGGYEEEDEDADANIVVGFLVIPGFRVSRSIVKCEVYLHSKQRHNDGRIVESPARTSNQMNVGHRTPDNHSSRSNRSNSDTGYYPKQSKYIEDREQQVINKSSSNKSSSNKSSGEYQKKQSYSSTSIPIYDKPTVSSSQKARTPNRLRYS